MFVLLVAKAQDFSAPQRLESDASQFHAVFHGQM
jgi:hypothetical protein